MRAVSEGFSMRRMAISLVAEPEAHLDLFDYPGNQSMVLMAQHFIPWPPLYYAPLKLSAAWFLFAQTAPCIFHV